MLGSLLVGATLAPAPSEARGLGRTIRLPNLAGKINIVDSHIDSHAQLALLDLMKAGGDAASDAVLIFAAVKARQLGGIYIQDQGVPALRAKAWGTSWWELIPKGLDAVVLPAPKSEPKGKPIIVLRKSIVSNAAKRNAALRDAWAAFYLAESGVISPCSSGTTVRQFAGARHCISDAPVPSSLPSSSNFVAHGGSVWPPFHKHYVTKKCARLFQPYRTCVNYVGVPLTPAEKASKSRNELPAPRRASAWSSKQTKHGSEITLAMLHTIFASELLPASSADGKTQRAHLAKFVAPMNKAFDLLGFDTVESKAHFLAHYAGELGGAPSLFSLEEILAKNAKHRCKTPPTFIGRGPLQPTCEGAFVLTLAYAEFEFMKRLRLAESTYVALAAKAASAAAAATFDQAEIDKLVAQLEDAKRLTREGTRLFDMAEAIARQPVVASEFEHGVMFSAMYWHANGCGQNLGQLAARAGNTSSADFTGGGVGSVCISGGNATSSSKKRAVVKSKVYNCAVATLRGKSC
jgi:hypothetical protein